MFFGSFQSHTGELGGTNGVGLDDLDVAHAEEKIFDLLIIGGVITAFANAPETVLSFDSEIGAAAFDVNGANVIDAKVGKYFVPDSCLANAPRFLIMLEQKQACG